MKKIIAVLLFCLMLSGCDNSVQKEQKIPVGPTETVAGAFTFVQSGDPWGISCYVKDLTNHSMTFQVEQFGGEFDGELQTGEWFQIYRKEEDSWIAVETNPLIDYAFTMVAYPIRKNEITEFEIQWKWLYGELASGDYRLDKKVMDFRGAGDFDEEIYSVYFTIE